MTTNFKAGDRVKIHPDTVLKYAGSEENRVLASKARGTVLKVWPAEPERDLPCHIDVDWADDHGADLWEVQDLALDI